jgi:autotransporter-associated beta strand protein
LLFALLSAPPQTFAADPHTITINSNGSRDTAYGNSDAPNGSDFSLPADNNQLIILNGIVYNAYGGRAQGPGDQSARNNSVEVFTDHLASYANTSIGGEAMVEGGNGNAVATGNSVHVMPNSVSSTVYGGVAYSGLTSTADNNSVWIEGKASRVSGGIARAAAGGTATVSNNTVLIGAGADVYIVYGGTILAGAGSANNNTVIVQGGTFHNNVYGGYAFSPTTQGDFFSGNTLVWEADVTIPKVLNFEFIQFAADIGTAHITLLDTTPTGAAGSPLVKLHTQADITLDGVITGSGGIEKTGLNRTLTLTGANTYTGDTKVSEGTLSIGSDDNIGGGVNTLAGATLLLTGPSYTKDWTLDAGDNVIDDNGGAVTLGGVLSGTGGFTKTGAGTLTLSGTNTYSGGTTVSAGTLAGDAASLQGNILNQTRVIFDQTGVGTYSGVMSGAGSLTKTGAGTLTLSGANTYGGGTTVSEGTLQGDTTSLQGFIFNDAAVIFDQTSDGTYAGAMSGTGSLTKTGAGTLTLTSGANTYSGGTTVSAGTLSIDSDANIGSGANMLDGGTLQLTGNSYAKDWTLGAGANAIDDNGGAVSFSGVLSGSGALIKTGAGTLTLSGTNTYSGGTTVSAGTLKGDATSLQGNIANNATIVFDQAGDGTYTGVLSGGGRLEKTGAGMLTLANTTMQDSAALLSGGLTIAPNTRLWLDGAFTIASGTTLGVTPDSALEDIHAASVTIASGATLDIASYSGSGSITLIKTDNGITGTFSNVLVGGNAVNPTDGLDSFMTATVTKENSNHDLVVNSDLVWNLSANAHGTFNVASDFTLSAGLADNTYSGAGTTYGWDGKTLTKTGAGTLTLTGANIYTGGSLVSAGTLAGNTTSLQGNIENNAAVVFDQTSAGTYAGLMSGTGSLTKTGVGDLTLSGANTYSGGTTISQGAIIAGSDWALGTGAVTMEGGATLGFSGNRSLVNAFILNSLATFDTSSGNGTLSGVVSGAGSLTKNGAGILTLAGNNTYSGRTTVNAGTLEVTGTLGGGSYAGNIHNDGTLLFNQSANQTLSGVISSDGSLTKTDTGTLTLAGANTYSGGTTVSGGTLKGDTTSLQGNIVNTAVVEFDQATDGTYAGIMSGGGNLTKSGAGTLTMTGSNTITGITVAAGTLVGSTSSLTTGNILNNGAVIFDQASDAAYSGSMSGTGSLTKTGAGTLILSNPNTYSGGTTVSAGTLSIVSDSNIGSGTNTLAGGTLRLTGSSYAKNWTLGAGSNIINNNGSPVAFNGVLSGSGGFTKAGGGTLTLAGNNTYSGDTALALAGDTLEVTGTLGNGSYAGNIANAGTLLFNQSANQTLSGVISGAGSLTKDGSGVLTLAGANTYSGGTTVNAGTLAVTGTLGNGSYAGNILNDGTLLFNQSANQTLSGVITGTGALTKQGNGMLTLAASATQGSASLTAGGLTLAPGAQLILSGAFNVASGTTLVLTPGSAADITAASMTIASNTTLNVTSYSSSSPITLITTSNGISGMFSNVLVGGSQVTTGLDSFLTGAGVYKANGDKDLVIEHGLVWNLTANAHGTFYVTSDFTLDAVLADNTTPNAGDYYGWDGKTLTKTGAGTLTLTGANTYSGGSVVSAGKLIAGSDTAFGTGAVTMAGGTTLGFSGVRSLINAFILNSLTTFDTSSGDGTLSGVVSGAGSLTKTGAGTLTLTGANTYSGGTTVSAGTLAGNATSLQGNILNNALVEFNQATAETYAGVMSGSGALTKTGTGTLTLTGANAYGNTTVSAGTLSIGGDANIGSGTNTLAGGTLLLTGSSYAKNWTLGAGSNAIDDNGGSVVFNGVLSGSGGFTKTGAGTLTLTGANSYGNTTVGAGTLSIGGDANIGSGTNTLAGGTLLLTGSSPYMKNWTLDAGSNAIDDNGGTVAFGGVLSGSGGFTKTGEGTLTLTGANTYSGGTTVFAGTLKGDTTSLQGDILNNFLVEFDQTSDGTYAGVMSGSGFLTKSGAGILTLTGANTYSGGTMISAGTLKGDTTSLQGDIANNATIIFDQTSDGTYAGVLSGTGALEKTGAGTLTLNSITMQDSATLSGGGLTLGPDSMLSLSGAFTVASGTTLGVTPDSALADITAASMTVNPNATLNIASYSGSGPITLIRTDSGISADFDTVLVAGNAVSTGLNSFMTATVTRENSNHDLVLNSSGLAWEQTTNAHGTFNVASDFTLSADLADNTTPGAGTTYGWDGTTLTKTGAGTLILTGANTYSGGSVVDAGTLQGNTASLPGDIVNNAAVVFDQTSAGTYAGTMSGTGALTKQGYGALTLAGTNTYSGGTTVSQGRIIAGSDAAFGTGAVTMDGGTTLGFSGDRSLANDFTLNSLATFDASSGNGALSGDISGAGSLTKTGAGTLTLAGANTYSGRTAVLGGTLSIGSDANIGSGANMLDGGTLQLTGNSYSKAWTLGAGSNAIDDNGGSVAFGGALSGSGGFTKTGAGTLTLAGANTYSGTTTVQAGTLALSGSGTISDKLALYNGTTFDTGGNAVSLSQLDVHGSAAYTGDLNMAGKTMNFYVPSAMGNGGSMLSVSGIADISAATANVGIEGSSSPLKAGDNITLIDAATLIGATANSRSRGEGMQGVTLKYEFDISIQGNRLQATVSGARVNEQTKALSEGFLSGLSLVNLGADLVAGPGMADAVRAARRAGIETGHGLDVFGTLSGGKVRYNSGSHVDMSSLSLLAGLSFGANLTPGWLTLGAFFEYGNGSYDTYNSFSNAASVQGDGNISHTGGGLLGRMDFVDTGPGHIYAEASFRAGNVQNSYSSSDLRDSQGRKAKYDSQSAYHGFHLGAGYVWNITDKASLDLYGKYLWTRQGGDSVKLSTGDPVDFDDTCSSRLRFGSRFAYTVNEYVSPYIGAAWEHEFDSKARATTNGYDMDAPSLRGDTGIGELGLTIKPSAKLPLTFDLGVQGYVGKREGVTGSLQAVWEF